MKLGLTNIRISDRGRTLVQTDEFSLEQNKVTFLFGESGIGKSMLSRAVYGLLDPSVLHIESDVGDYAGYLNSEGVKKSIAEGFFVFQEPSTHLNPLLTIRHQLNEGSLKGSDNEGQILANLWGRERVPDLKNILELYPKPHRPSGGEKQRLLLAMAFKKMSLHEGGPGMFVFDEPTGSLDNNYRNSFLQMIFDRFASRPFTALIITHDYSIISEVMQSYPTLASKVDYKELSRLGSGAVALKDFSPDSYLGWLNKVRGSSITGRQTDIVLKVEPQFSVFGRNLEICRDQEGTAPAPFIIRRGETVYLKAPSGTGKTTIAKIIMGLYRADKVAFNLAGLEINEKTPIRVWEKQIWGKAAGMVFQHADESLNLEANIQETFKGLPIQGGLSADKLKNALGTLFDEDISAAFLKKKVARLSGGQKQRLNLLRTLIMAPQLVILDEPLNGLDFESIKKVLSILEALGKKGSAFLMISHNEEIFESYVDKDKVYYLKERA